MPVVIALFRGINVGGTHVLPMAGLREVLTELGLRGIETYIQSGNAVFEAPVGDIDGLPAAIAEAVETRFGFAPPVLLRRAEELDAAIAANPFPEQLGDHQTLHLGFMAEAPEIEAFDRFKTVESGRDRFEIIGRELYLAVPDGLGRSRLAAALIGSKASPTLTMRNWRTVLKLQDMARQTG
jgi:uncharacterized protein (DUF1697 family)